MLLDRYTIQKINEYADRLIAEEQQKKKNKKMFNKRRCKKVKRSKIVNDLLYDHWVLLKAAGCGHETLKELFSD